MVAGAGVNREPHRCCKMDTGRRCVTRDGHDGSCTFSEPAKPDLSGLKFALRRTPPPNPKACPFCDCIRCACSAPTRADFDALGKAHAEFAEATNEVIKQLRIEYDARIQGLIDERENYRLAMENELAVIRSEIVKAISLASGTPIVMN